MGGQIGTFIRFSDGSVLGKNTWTNSIFSRFKCYEFQKEDKEFIYNSFHVDDEDCFYPDQYGFLYVDFIDRKILHSQDYSIPLKINIGTFYSIGDTFNSIEKCINSKIINKIEYYDHAGGFADIETKPTFYETMCEVDPEFTKIAPGRFDVDSLLETFKNTSILVINFFISGWKEFQYDQNISDFNKAFDVINKELPLSKSDKICWENFSRFME